MPPLSSFITYRPVKKAKAAIKAPFSLLRGDTSSTISHQQFTDVIDINNSFDFDGGRPTPSFDQDVFDDPQSSHHNLSSDTSPQVELDIDLSPNGFSDWLKSFSDTDHKQDIATLKRFTRLRNSMSLNPKHEKLKQGAGEAEVPSKDIDASIQAINPSHLDTESDGILLQGSSSLNYITSSPITVPDGSSANSHQTSWPPDLFIGARTARPLSSQSDTTSSALSGTTLARALMSNSFILSTAPSSVYRSGTSAGLTRSDSTTLPRNSSTTFYSDKFSIESDAPPIPPNAELIYEPPRKSRNEEKRTQRHFTHSSTDSLSPKIYPDTPPVNITHSNSDIINADSDLEDSLSKTPPQERPSRHRSPLPRTPTSKLMIDEATIPDQASTSTSLQEATQQIPVDAQPLSPDFETQSPTLSSEGHNSPKELEGLLNYYSIPDSPEPSVTGGIFRPIFSPISEESLSQLSPSLSHRNDRRDSQRSQPAGARNRVSGSHRIREDSTLLPKQDQRAGPSSQNLLSVEGGVQSNIPLVSPTTPTDSSFYFSADDNPDATAISTNLNHQKASGPPSPITVVRNSRDMSAYNVTMASFSGDATPSTNLEGLMVSQEFPETPDAFSPMFSARPSASDPTFQPALGHERSPMPSTPISTAILERSDSNSSHSVPAAQLILKQASVRRSRQGSLSTIRTTATVRPGSPSKCMAAVLESSGVKPSTLSSTADDTITEDTPELPSPELSADQSNISLPMDVSRSPSGHSIELDTSDVLNSMHTSLVDMDSASTSEVKCLPAIPMISPIVPPSPFDESSMSLPETSPTPAALAEPIITPPSPQAVKLSAPRGRLPSALTISKHTSVSGPPDTVAVNGADQSVQNSPELESQQTQHDSPGSVPSDPSLTQSSLVYSNRAFSSRASDIFRGTSLGSPPPYYTVVSEALMQDHGSPNFLRSSTPLSHFQGSDNIAGPSSEESAFSNDIGRNLARDNSLLSQRARTRPPLPAGPRRPSQQITSSPGSRHGSFSSVARHNNNPIPLPNFQVPPPKWKGYTMEVAKWTFTSAQLQAIVSRAIRQSAEASSIRLLRLEVLDNEIPAEIQRLVSQGADIKTRYKTVARRRVTILDSLHSSLSTMEDSSSIRRLLRQLDELKELTQTLDRLAEEIHSVDQQLSQLECLTRIHTDSALSIALRKLNTSFLKQVAENQVLRSQIQSLEAERDEAWQQARNVADEYDQQQINDNNNNNNTNNNSPTTTTTSSPKLLFSSRVSARHESSIRVSRAGLRSTPNQWISSQRSSVGSGGGGAPPPPPIINLTSTTTTIGNRSPGPPLLRRRPMDISTDSSMRNSAALSSAITPTTESRALAQAQDELYAMLGILNPEQQRSSSLHYRSRSESSPGSPATSHFFLSPRSAEGSSFSRRSSLPSALSLTEAYNVMAADRNAVLATIDMLSATE